MSRTKKTKSRHPHECATSVIKRFISPDRSQGAFFVDNAIPKQWEPILLSADPIWAAIPGRTFSAWIAVELRNFDAFDSLDDLSVSDMSGMGRPMAEWMRKLRRVETWDQAGGFLGETGHWQFRYREARSDGALDIWIFRKKGRIATLLASISERRIS